MANAMEDAEEKGLEQVKRVCFKFAFNVRKLFFFLTRPSVTAYFMYSALFYLGTGIWIYVLDAKVVQFLCNIEAEYNSTTNLGVGCSNCDDILLLCGKEPCLRHAFNETYNKYAKSPELTLYQGFATVSADSVCSGYVQEANNIFDILTPIKANNDASAACKQLWCAVLKISVSSSDLYNANGGDCTNNFGSKRPYQAKSCVCQADVQTMIGTGAKNAGFVSYCSVALPTPVPATIAPTTAPTAAPTGSGASARLLEKLYRASDMVFARQLQATTTKAGGGTTADNKDYPAYETDAWSPCNCYLQCLRGIRTRTVKCSAATCKEPKPAAQEACTCGPCALCDVTLNLLLLYITFFIQGGSAFLVALCFAFYEFTNEETRLESLIKIRFYWWPVGFMSKQLPPFVRILVIVNCVQLAILLCQVFLPESTNKTNKDCGNSFDLTVLAVVAAGIVVFQIFLGVVAKKFTRKPPYLYSPDRASWIPIWSQLKWIMKSLGP